MNKKNQMFVIHSRLSAVVQFSAPSFGDMDLVYPIFSMLRFLPFHLLFQY